MNNAEKTVVAKSSTQIRAMRSVEPALTALQPEGERLDKMAAARFVCAMHSRINQATR